MLFPQQSRKLTWKFYDHMNFMTRNLLTYVLKSKTISIYLRHSKFCGSISDKKHCKEIFDIFVSRKIKRKINVIYSFMLSKFYINKNRENMSIKTRI